jgi:hypothetical protein
MFSKDALLIAICEVIQISEPKYLEAEQRYQTISQWLGKEGSVFEYDNPVIYPQGSFAIQTTVRPYGEVQEYDLDFVMELKNGAPRYNNNPRKLLDDLEKRLKENGNYEAIVERMNRCIRLNYAGDFHLDILPALPDDSPGFPNRIMVPDRELIQYKASNPKGYRSWFEDRSCQDIQLDCSIEQLVPLQTAAQKPNLCNIVQLAKRARDVRFDDPAISVRSIVLTTLLAKYYSPGTSLIQELSLALTCMNQLIARDWPRIIEVYNPKNPDEKLSECWDKHPEQYEKFASWMLDFHRAIDQLQSLQNPEFSNALKEIFGENVVVQAIRCNAQKTDELRSSDHLRVQTRGLNVGRLGRASAALAAVPVKKNTFYGED